MWVFDPKVSQLFFYLYNGGLPLEAITKSIEIVQAT